MQTLIFYTTKKRVVLNSETRSGYELISFDDVPTVKIEDGYYEVMQKTDTNTIPVLRVPISNTNMLIQK
jgi:hypothetical protein